MKGVEKASGTAGTIQPLNLADGKDGGNVEVTGVAKIGSDDGSSVSGKDPKGLSSKTVVKFYPNDIKKKDK